MNIQEDKNELKDITYLINESTCSKFPDIRDIFPPRDEECDPEEINLTRYDAEMRVKKRCFSDDSRTTQIILLIGILIEVLVDALKRKRDRYRYRGLKEKLQGSFPCGLRVGPVVELDYQLQLIPLGEKGVTELREIDYEKQITKHMSVRLRNKAREEVYSEQILDDLEADLIDILKEESDIKNTVQEKSNKVRVSFVNAMMTALHGICISSFIEYIIANKSYV